MLFWVDILLAMADSKSLSLDICALSASEVYTFQSKHHYL